MTSDPEETSVTIQEVNRESIKYMKTERDDPSWVAQEGRLLIPASNLDLIPVMRSTGTSMDIFVRGVAVGFTHTENLIIKSFNCPMTFQSDNRTAFVGELTKELMRRSQVAQAHSRTYHPQTNGLVERQIMTLVSMLRVFCSRYMTDWDRYLPQVMGAYNSTQHSTTGISPHMMLTGHQKSLPLTFFYPEYEGKKTSPQVYLRDMNRCQQELNELCRRNNQQAQARQKKKFDKKAVGTKAQARNTAAGEDLVR